MGIRKVEDVTATVGMTHAEAKVVYQAWYREQHEARKGVPLAEDGELAAEQNCFVSAAETTRRASMTREQRVAEDEERRIANEAAAAAWQAEQERRHAEEASADVALIREMLSSGDTDVEIFDWLTERYSDW